MDRLVCTQTCRLVGTQTCLQTGRQVGWQTDRLTGSQEARRNKEMKFIEAITGISTLCSRSGGSRGGQRNCHHIPSVCVTGQNQNIGGGGGGGGTELI
jgi:hypothetical protein